jgi:hypothetical protein
MDPSTSTFLGGLGQVAGGLAPLLGTGSQLYGQQNASEAVVNANQGAINQQNATLGNINTLYNPYTSIGSSATTQLGNAEGLNGAQPDYSSFLNMPGYQFAVNQGTQAIQRQAAAMGSAYTPNTAQAVGQYVTGTAMQDYNTYIQQLQAAAGMGQTATGQLGNITYNTGANISQLMSNTGQSQAGMYTGMGQTLSGALGGYAGASGVGGAAGAAGAAAGYGSIASGIGNIANGIGNIVNPVSTVTPSLGMSDYIPTTVDPSLTSANYATPGIDSTQAPIGDIGSYLNLFGSGD